MAFVLQRRLSGMAEGNFHPAQQPRDQFLALVARTMEKYFPLWLPSISAPDVGFTNRLWMPAMEDPVEWSSWFCRSPSPADGVIVEGPRKVVAIFNADCPVVCLVQDDLLALLHAGYRCLERAETEEKNIIEEAIKYFYPPNTHATIQYGICPLCWVPEYKQHPEIGQPKLSRHSQSLERCIGRTTRTPGDGWGRYSVDLYQYAYLLLRSVGVPEHNISWDTTCTCCAMAHGTPLYWSYTRYKAGLQEIDGRNMALAWLEKV